MVDVVEQVRDAIVSVLQIQWRDIESYRYIIFYPLSVSISQFFSYLLCCRQLCATFDSLLDEERIRVMEEVGVLRMAGPVMVTVVI